MAPRRKPSEPGISRIDQAARRTYGWFVRVSAYGHLLSKFFPDRAHGGKPKALAAAKRHRDAVRGALLGRVKVKADSIAMKKTETGWAVMVNGKPRPFDDDKYGANAKNAATLYRAAVAMHQQMAAD
jgi:hypothetical protein